MTDKQIKNYFNMTALGFLAYAILLQILSVIAIVLLGIAFPALSSDAMYYSMMIAVIPCMLFLYFLFKNNNTQSITVHPELGNEDFSADMNLNEAEIHPEESSSSFSGGYSVNTAESKANKGSFSPRIFLHYFLLFSGVQWISSLLTMPLVLLFQKIGMDLSYSEMAAKGGALDNIPMLIYTVLFAPVVEELVFRGVFYKRFKAFGGFFTAFASSLFFALIHSNFLQFIPAFMMGFVLYLIRNRYGLRYSILLHLTNNALAILVNNLGASQLWILYAYGFVLLGGTVYTLSTLIKNRAKLSNFLPGKEEKKNLKLFLTSPVVWLNILILVILAIVIMLNPAAGDMATTV